MPAHARRFDIAGDERMWRSALVSFSMLVDIGTVLRAQVDVWRLDKQKHATRYLEGCPSIGRYRSQQRRLLMKYGRRLLSI